MTTPDSHPHRNRLSTLSLKWAALAAGAIMTIAAAIEYAMGRVPICKCGYVRLWVGKVESAENSQQIADWYSFSHIIHGFIFYGLFHLLGRRRWSLGLRLLLAVLVESSWEVFENSSYVINYYRHQTLSWGYAGDSILNSMSDILFAVLGFFMAAKIPVWLTVALIVVMEVGVAIAIRDNLTLNIIMFLHPFQAIKHWQMGPR